jgi:hypothetical protein
MTYETWNTFLHLEKKVLFIIKKGYLAVLIEGHFEEPLLVLGRTLCGKGSTWNPKEFYLESKRGLLWGQPHPFGTLFSKRCFSSPVLRGCRLIII